MPELPEVESLRRSLVPHVVGQKIQSVVVHKPKLVSSKGTVRRPSSSKKKKFERGLVGETITQIDRRAKNLIIHFESGKVLLVHLKMTGQLVYQEDGQRLALGGHPIEASEHELPNKHSHIIFELERGTLFYNDVRMFGYLLLYDSYDQLTSEQHFDNLGVDPLSEEFTLEVLQSGLSERKAKLKTVLMNQEVVTGLGNIYADEACFAAGVRPDRTCNSLSEAELVTLHAEIQRIIRTAVDQGGSSVANYIMADGSRGTYAREHKVYGKGGKECLVCGNALVKTTMNNRTTVFCLHCQQ